MAIVGKFGEYGSDMYVPVDSFRHASHEIQAVKCTACGARVIDTERARKLHIALMCPAEGEYYDPDELYEEGYPVRRVEDVQLPTGDAT